MKMPEWRSSTFMMEQITIRFLHYIGEGQGATRRGLARKHNLQETEQDSLSGWLPGCFCPQVFAPFSSYSSCWMAAFGPWTVTRMHVELGSILEWECVSRI